MDKTPNKRKSLAKANTTPFKVQKTGGTPVSQKKNNKSPKFMNKTPKTTPQKKQPNGKQNTPKGNKKPKQTVEDEEEDDVELFNDSEENDSDNSIEQAENSESNGDSDNSDEEDGESDEQTTVKTKEKQPNIADRKFSVYVGGLNYETTETALRSHFNDVGILSLSILRFPVSKKSKGSAFVNFVDESSLQKALLKNESKLDGRTIKVSVQKKIDKSDEVARKQKTLNMLKAKVQKLEKDLGITSGITSGITNKKEVRKGKFIKKNFGNKKAVKV